MPRIAILPFADMSMQKDQEYFCDGLAEELITDLRGLEGLQVLPRTSSFRFRGTNMGIREIGKQLAVDFLLEGSVRKSGQKLRIILNLISADSEAPIWTERYDRDLVEVFALQDEITQHIRQKLKATLLHEEKEQPEEKVEKEEKVEVPVVEPPQQSVDAYEHYLRARYEWNKRIPESLRRSVGLFKSAIAKHSDYALAHAGLADAYVTLAVHGDTPPMECMPLARQSAERALELNGGLAEAHTSLACIEAVFDWNWPEADRRFQHAIELDPKYSTARQWYAMHCLVPLGRFAEAREQLDIALENDPDSLVIQITNGVEWYFEKQFEKAEEEYRKVLEKDPGFALAHYFLGEIYVHLDRGADAIGELQKAAEITGRSAEAVAALAYGYAATGNRIDAVQLAMELTRRSIQGYISPVLQAKIRIGLGDLDRVFEYLENAYRAKSVDLIWIGARPSFEPIRTDPRFQDLSKRIGLA